MGFLNFITRYPIFLQKFSLAEGTGGQGQWLGGDGVERVMKFRKPLELSVLTEKEFLHPMGWQVGGLGPRG